VVNVNDLVIYTCTVNNYDYLSLVQRPVKGVRFVFFTDRLNKVPAGWEGQYLKSPPRLKNGHDINRFHKIFPHHLFPEYKYSIYIDGNVNYKGDFVEIIEKLITANVALAAFKHPSLQRTIEGEVDACMHANKFDAYDLQRIELQLNKYKAEGLDLSQLITANYLLARDHAHPNFDSCMSLWWSHLFEYSKRDQINLCYALWKEQLPWAFLDDDLNIASELLTRHNHTKKRQYKKLKKLILKTKKLLGN